MKKIVIGENKLILLKESEEEVTFYQFFTELKNFLKKLLTDPIGAQPSIFFSKHGIDRKTLINKLLERGVINRKEKIDEPIDADGNMKSMHYLKYSIPRQNFENKIHRLYTEFFEMQPKKEKRYASVATYIYCYDEDGDVCILAGKRRGRRTKGLYNVPTGLIGDKFKSEHPSDAAVREVAEESGIRISKGMLQDAGEVPYENYYGKQLGKEYMVMLNGTTSQHPTGKGDGENDQFEWLKLKDVDTVPWAFNMNVSVKDIAKKIIR